MVRCLITVQVHTTLCKCVDSMFVVNVRAGRSVKVALSEANENMLRNVLNTCAKKIKLPSSESRLVFFCYSPFCFVFSRTCAKTVKFFSFVFVLAFWNL